MRLRQGLTALSRPSWIWGGKMWETERVKRVGGKKAGGTRREQDPPEQKFWLRPWTTPRRG